ncbi:hypothetical protein [Brevibacillus dissolubilis]|uniref:hypothetical protein n=1 Tax=Brevibacillus dissolubilis TaxID=1844116 RepID=UPI00159BE52B|nr:hypothetical protein [Brevibacillus dissolubilis]
MNLIRHVILHNFAAYGIRERNGRPLEEITTPELIEEWGYFERQQQWTVSVS